MTPSLLLACLLVPALARAEPVCTPGDPSSCVVSLNKGDAAPFTGQLLTSRLAITIGQKAEHCDERVLLEVAHTASVSHVRLDYERRLHEIDVAQLTRESAAYAKSATKWQAEAERKVEPPSFFTSPYFVVPVTVILTLGAVWAGVEVVNAARHALP